MARANSTTSITLSWNDKGLKDIFEQLKPEQQAEAQKAAIKTAGTSLRKIVQQDARSAGLGRTAAKSNDGWEWQTYGRIPNSIVVGKAWRRKGTLALRVYVASGRRWGFLKRAPHANPVIAGYKQKIPSGKTGPAVYSGETKAGRPIFGRASRLAPEVFKKAVESNLRKTINRLNKKYGGAR